MLHAASALAHEPRFSPQLTVAFSLTKGEKPELAVQKLTELGVDRIVVVEAARSVVRWDDARAAAAMERLQRVARERRCAVAARAGPAWSTDRSRRSTCSSTATSWWPRSTGSAAGELAAPVGGEWVVAVGPEGGFDDAELAAFGAAPRLALGPFVLRAETAAIAAAAALAGRRTPLRP